MILDYINDAITRYTVAENENHSANDFLRGAVYGLEVAKELIQKQSNPGYIKIEDLMDFIEVNQIMSLLDVKTQ